jgi:8-oxo-dGTP pyrophosphatase MutT (NUDIX family)
VLLLGRQGSKRGPRPQAGRLHLLGGKRERSDESALETALREAEEESLGLLGAARLRRELLGPVLWWPQGKFALWMYELPASHELGQLPQAFAHRVGREQHSGGEVVDALEWVQLPHVTRLSRAKQLGVSSFSRSMLMASPLLRYFDERGL